MILGKCLLFSRERKNSWESDVLPLPLWQRGKRRNSRNVPRGIRILPICPGLTEAKTAILLGAACRNPRSIVGTAVTGQKSCRASHSFRIMSSAGSLVFPNHPRMSSGKKILLQIQMYSLFCFHCSPSFSVREHADVQQHSAPAFSSWRDILVPGNEFILCGAQDL